MNTRSYFTTMVTIESGTNRYKWNYAPFYLLYFAFMGLKCSDLRFLSFTGRRA